MAEPQDRLKEVRKAVQRFYDAYMEQLDDVRFMDVPELQETEELRKVLITLPG